MIDNFTVYKGGSYNEVVIFDAERFGGVSDDILLDDSLLNYDTIVITVKETDGLHSYYIPVSEFYISLNNSGRPWCNDDETLFLFPTSEMNIDINSTGNAKVYKVIGISNRRSQEDTPETHTSVRLTSSGKQAFLDYCDDSYSENDSFFMIAPLVAVNSTTLKYYDYNYIIEDFIDGDNNVQTSYDVPLARYSMDIDTFKSVATVIETEEADCPIYVYASMDNPSWRESVNSPTPYMFYYCEKQLKLTNNDKAFVNTLWNKYYQLSLRDADVSEMTNMDELFKVGDDSSITPTLPSEVGLSNVFIDVTGWDTSNVSSMVSTFENLGHNTDYPRKRLIEYLLMFGLDTWDVSNVSNMEALFYTNFSRFIDDEGTPCTRVVKFDNWDVTLVSNADYMFRGFCSDYIPLNLNFKNCKSMVGTLMETYTSFGIDRSEYTNGIPLNWNIPKVRNMSHMFDTERQTGYYRGDNNESLFSCPFNLKNLNTTNVENMSYIFNGTQFDYEVYPTIASEIGLNNWDVSNVSNMEGAFKNANSNYGEVVTFDISDWDVSYVKNMSDMFYTDLVYGYSMLVSSTEQWNTHNVEDFSGMCSTVWPEEPTPGYHDGAGFHVTWSDYENLDLRSAKTVAYMFHGQIPTEYETIDFSNWDTSNISDFTSMFGGYTGYYSPDGFTMDLSNWDFTNVLDSSKQLLFDDLWSTGKITLYANNWKFNVYNQDIFTFLTTAYSEHAVETELYVENWDISQIHNLNNLFEGLLLVDNDITLDSSGDGWNTSNIFNVSELFKDTAFRVYNENTLSMQNWDMSNCTHFDDMFAFALPPSQLNLYNWIVPSSFDFHDAGFAEIPNSGYFTANLSNWSFDSRTDLSEFFKDFSTYSGITIDGISGWETSDITNMSSMFENARMYDDTGYFGDSGINTYGLDSWNTSSVTNMSKMFKNISQPLPLSALDYWDISSCVNFNQMLYTTDPTDWNYIWYDDTAPDEDKIRKRPNWDGYWDEDGTFHPNNGTISGTMEFVGVYQDFDTLGYYLEEHWKPSEAYINNGAFYIYDDQTDSNYNGLYVFDDGQWLVPNTLTLDSIFAIFNQSEVGTITPSSSLDDLVPGLNVRQDYGAYGQGTITFWDFYNNGSEFANGYTLSGTLAVGTSTITVSIDIGGTTYTDTIEVTVTADS